MKKKKTSSKIVTIGVPIAIGALVVASTAFCGYNAYRYYTYPKMKSVHCYANNEGEKLDVYYTIINDKISKKVEEYTYSIANEEKANSAFDDSITYKYKGYAQKLWKDENEIMTMKVYNFDDLSDSDIKDLLGADDKDKYLKGDKDTIKSHYDNKGFTCEWSD